MFLNDLRSYRVQSCHTVTTLFLMGLFCISAFFLSLISIIKNFFPFDNFSLVTHNTQSKNVFTFLSIFLFIVAINNHSLKSCFFFPRFSTSPSTPNTHSLKSLELTYFSNFFCLVIPYSVNNTVPPKFSPFFPKILIF